MSTPNRSLSRPFGRLLASCILIATLSGCLTGPQFREQALPSIESGVNLILDGFVDGLFAAIEVEPNSTSNNPPNG